MGPPPQALAGIDSVHGATRAVREHQFAKAIRAQQGSFLESPYGTKSCFDEDVPVERGVKIVGSPGHGDGVLPGRAGAGEKEQEDQGQKGPLHIVSGKTFRRRGIFPRPFRCVSHAFEGTGGNARCPSAKRIRRETAIRPWRGRPAGSAFSAQLREMPAKVQRRQVFPVMRASSGILQSAAPRSPEVSPLPHRTQNALSRITDFLKAPLGARVLPPTALATQKDGPPTRRRVPLCLDLYGPPRYTGRVSAQAADVLSLFRPGGLPWTPCNASSPAVPAVPMRTGPSPKKRSWSC